MTALHGLIYSDLVERHGAERAAAYAAAASTAIDLVRSIVHAEGIACELERHDAYTYAETNEGADAIHREVGACRAIGLDAELVYDVPLPFPVSAAIRLRNQAQFHPRAYCLGARRCDPRHQGTPIRAHLRFGGAGEGPHLPRQDGPRDPIDADGRRCDALPFMGDGSYYAKTAPSRSYAMAFPDGESLQGMFLSAEHPVRSMRPASAGGRRWLILGGESHKVGQEDDTEARYTALESWAAERLQMRDPVYRWSAQDCVSVDGIPYVGRLTSDHERVFVATGFRKWGMTNGTAAGMIIADPVAGRENPWAMAFDSTRIRLVQSAKKLLKENLNVAKEFIGGKLAVSGHTPEELGRGEARIMSVDGETLAVHRDDAGRLHAVSPDCTHMGCRVAWNTAERTWDCSCHGSRFTPDGEVIQAPATQPLKRQRIPVKR